MNRGRVLHFHLAALIDAAAKRGLTTCEQVLASDLDLTAIDRYCKALAVHPASKFHKEAHERALRYIDSRLAAYRREGLINGVR